MASVATTSRIWSCGTLEDGIQHVVDLSKLEEEEELELERQIQDCFASEHISYARAKYIVYIEGIPRSWGRRGGS